MCSGELALCFTTVCLVTDLDAGVEGDAGVTHAEVMEVFAANIERLRGLLSTTIPGLPAAEDDATATCGCRRVLDGLTLPFPLGPRAMNCTCVSACHQKASL